MAIYMATLVKPRLLGAKHSDNRSVQVVQCRVSGFARGEAMGPVAEFSYVAAIDLQKLAEAERGALLMNLRRTLFVTDPDVMAETAWPMYPDVLQLIPQWESSARHWAAFAILGPSQLVQDGLLEIMKLESHLSDEELAARRRRLAAEWIEAVESRGNPPFKTKAQRASLLKYGEVAADYAYCMLTGIQDPAAEIAKRHGANRSTVRSWIHRARKHGLLWMVPEMVDRINLSPDEAEMVAAALPADDLDLSPTDPRLPDRDGQGDRDDYLRRLDGLAHEVERLKSELAAVDYRQASAG
jgi:hypothetical protein